MIRLAVPGFLGRGEGSVPHAPHNNKMKLTRSAMARMARPSQLILVFYEPRA